MRATVAVVQPDVLVPDSTTDLSVLVESQEESAYHLKSVSVSPTWTSDTVQTVPIDKTLFPGTDRYIAIDGVSVPAGIDGRAGFSIGFEVSEFLEDEMDYYMVWTDPLELEVTTSH